MSPFWFKAGTAALIVLWLVMLLFAFAAFRLTEPVRADDDVAGADNE